VSGPSYLRVWRTFLRNSLVREMTFRGNFLITVLTRAFYFAANLVLFEIIYRNVPAINGWSKWEYYAFMATGMLINALVETFFMPNCANFSELIRTGGLDFALLKPIDTQFLISLEKVDWSSLANFAAGIVLLIVSLVTMTTRSENPLLLRPEMILLYVFYVLCGVAILYSLMIALSATSIWLGQNRSLYDFWFYITNFSRYPMEIYNGRLGTPLRLACTYLVPVLIVVNVPAQIIARPVSPAGQSVLPLAIFALFATATSLLVSRWVFVTALRSYRSASS
jgi:ABC-2 type transport system permease protein